MSQRKTTRGAMLLRSWREAQKLKQRDVCAKLKLDGGRYSAFETGRQRPGLPMAVRIEKLTEGVVPATSWMDAVREARAS